MDITMQDLGILSSYTRRKLLKILSSKRMALPDISSVTGMSKSTLHEHLAKLHQKGFVEREGQEGRKPVYYSATEKGTRLIQNEARVIVLSDIALASFVGGFFFIYKYMSSAFGRVAAMKAEAMLAAEDAAIKAAPMLSAVEERAVQAAPESARETMMAAGAKSSLWLFAGILLILFAGLVIYALFRKRID